MAAPIRPTSSSPVSSSLIEDDFDLDALLNECLENFQTAKLEESDDKKQELAAVSSSLEIRPQETSLSRAVKSDADEVLDECLDFPDELLPPTVPYTTLAGGSLSGEFMDSRREAFLREALEKPIREYRANPDAFRDGIVRSCILPSKNDLGDWKEVLAGLSESERECLESMRISLEESISSASFKEEIKKEISSTLNDIGFGEEQLVFLLQQKEILIDIEMAHMDAMSKQAEVIIPYILRFFKENPTPPMSLPTANAEIHPGISMRSNLESFLKQMPPEVWKEFFYNCHEYIEKRYFPKTEQQENL